MSTYLELSFPQLTGWTSNLVDIIMAHHFSSVSVSVLTYIDGVKQKLNLIRLLLISPYTSRTQNICYSEFSVLLVTHGHIVLWTFVFMPKADFTTSLAIRV